ncbi:hypothetical protein ACFQYP_57435 [Nonomuraea antimicrobica]
MTRALIVVVRSRYEAVSIALRTPASSMEVAYIVSVTSVTVASRIDPNAARRSSGSLSALLTTNGPRMLPPSPAQ